MLKKLRDYYGKVGISAENHRCQFLEDCRQNNTKFTGPKEAYVGREYISGEYPRLLFLSSDSGHGEQNPAERTVEAVRDWVENQCDINELSKNGHWFKTYELALAFLKPFNPSLKLDNIHLYFAHTNSAKCCMNKDGNKEADEYMFWNCQGNVSGELEVLQPSILVTQGAYAKYAVEATTFSCSVYGEQKECGYAYLEINKQKVLWIHTYHPCYYKGYPSQKKNCLEKWVKIIGEYMSDDISFP